MSEFGVENIGKLLLFIGVAIGGVGILLIIGSKVPGLWRIPGDVFFQRGNVSFSIPLVSSIVLSLLLTVILNVLIFLMRHH